MTPTPDTPRVQCHVLDTGYCTASEHHLIQGGRRKRVSSIPSPPCCNTRRTAGSCGTPATPRACSTPRAGCRSASTAGSRRCTFGRSWPSSPSSAAFGLAPRDVRRVVVSHFHADHVAGLRDFPNADLVALRSAYEDVAGRRGLGLAVAFVPALMPDDFDRRAMLLPPFAGPALGNARADPRPVRRRLGCAGGVARTRTRPDGVAGPERARPRPLRRRQRVAQRLVPGTPAAAPHDAFLHRRPRRHARHHRPAARFRGRQSGRGGDSEPLPRSVCPARRAGPLRRRRPAFPCHPLPR